MKQQYDFLSKDLNNGPVSIMSQNLLYLRLDYIYVAENTHICWKKF